MISSLTSFAKDEIISKKTFKTVEHHLSSQEAAITVYVEPNCCIGSALVRCYPPCPQADIIATSLPESSASDAIQWLIRFSTNHCPNCASYVSDVSINSSNCIEIP